MKRKKLLIDILLFCTLLISFVTGKNLAHSDTVMVWVAHIAFSVAFIILMVIHLFVNGRGWFDAGKKLFRGEKYKSVRGRYVVDWLLMIVWVVVFLSGFPAIGYKLGVESMFVFTKVFHSGFSNIGIILSIVHVIQHKNQIRSYFTKQKDA